MVHLYMHVVSYQLFAHSICLFCPLFCCENASLTATPHSSHVCRVLYYLVVVCRFLHVCGVFFQTLLMFHANVNLFSVVNAMSSAVAQYLNVVWDIMAHFYTMTRWFSVNRSCKPLICNFSPVYSGALPFLT